VITEVSNGGDGRDKQDPTDRPRLLHVLGRSLKE